MSLLSFFKKKNKSGADSTVSSEELLNETDQVQEKTEVHTELSIHPSMSIPQEQQYVLRFLNNDLAPLKPNQISLAGIELHETEDGLVISAFVRNSLPKAITFGNTDLILIGPNGEKLARKSFDLSVLGELPAESSRPWNFTFERFTLTSDNIPREGWKLAFELKPKHRLDLDETWEKNLPAEVKARLTEMLETLPPLQEGEINLLGLEAKMTEQNDLRVTILIRNGSNKNIMLEQIPLQIQDASGEFIARGGFKMENFEVKAHSSKPWNFIFPNNLLLKENLDLSSWKASTIPNDQDVTHM
jgi:accessory Sec system S-layer assembly protein